MAIAFFAIGFMANNWGWINAGVVLCIISAILQLAKFVIKVLEIVSE